MTFDGAGNRFDYGIDGDHRVTSVPELNTTFAYDARSRVSTITYTAISPNPATTRHYTYDGMGHVLTTTGQAGGNLGTSMISKSQEETEVSWRLEEWALEAGVERLS